MKAAQRAFGLCLLLALWDGNNNNNNNNKNNINACEAKTPHVWTLRRPTAADSETVKIQISTLLSVSTKTLPRGGGGGGGGGKEEQEKEAAWKSGIKNSMASALAAASSKLLLAPLDTIKTLQQTQITTGQATLSVMQAARIILQRPKGFLELYVRQTMEWEPHKTSSSYYPLSPSYIYIYML